MAVDIALVLRSEHRRLGELSARCCRRSRGFHNPQSDLRLALRAHVLAASAEIYPRAVELGGPDDWPAARMAAIRHAAESPDTAPAELVAATRELILAEEQRVVGLLEVSLELPERRRMGRAFRLRRDANLRGGATGPRRRRSQTELYELARRAGVERRSRMTQAQLQAAMDARGVSG